MDHNEYYKWMVCVHCSTYNHSLYITDALNGFCMQETCFPYVCVVVDDASTDGEQEILRRYVEDEFNTIKDSESSKEETDDYAMVFAQHRTNKSCYIALYQLKYNHYKLRSKKSKFPYYKRWDKESKYCALCEGDDYWIHPQKLQMQYDFLENNENYSCCYTSYKCYNEREKEVVGIYGTDYRDVRQMLWDDVNIATASLFFRRKFFYDFLDEIGTPSQHGWLMGDKPLFFYLGYRGLTKLIPEVTTVYRILESSMSHSTDIELQLKRARNTIDIYHFFAEKYFPNDQKLKYKLEGGYLYRAYYMYKKFGLEYPKELRNEIFAYKGSYRKVYIVKLMLKLPILEKIVYGTLNRINKLKVIFLH